MNVEIVTEAGDELQAAAEFYAASADRELARVFLAEFNRALTLIASNPGLGRALNGNCRKFLMRRFPYSLIYQVKFDTLRILAVAHQRRRPAYWKKRK
jgi:toxin ParE1/3/4